MMYWHDGGWGAGAWIAMAFVMLVFWAIVIAAIVALVRSDRTNSHHYGPRGSPNAEQLLAKRFAHGEIDADEFTRRRDLLKSR